MRRPSTTIFLLMLWAGSSLAATEIPRPDVADAEERVRAKVRVSYARVAAHPDDGEAWGSYGMTLDAHRMNAAAVIAYEEAQRLDPKEFRWPYYLGSILEYEDPARALDWYQRAIDIDGDYAPAQIRIAQTFEVLGDDDQAFRHFARAEALDSTDPLAPFGRGRIVLSRGDPEGARHHLERAYSLDSEIQAVVATLARLYHQVGERDLARVKAAEARGLPRMTHHRDARRAAVRQQAVDTESFLRRSKTYIEVGQLDSARRELETLLALEPDLAEAHFSAAGVYDRLGQPRLALASARRTLELDPELPGARSVVAGALFKMQRLTEADAEARRVLLDEADNFHMLMIVGMVAAENGDIAAMIDSLDRAFEVRSESSPLRGLLVQMYADLADSFAAINDLDQAAHRMSQALEVAQEMAQPRSTINDLQRRRDAYLKR